MLAESWRPARPKPTDGPASVGRTTHCCTKSLRAKRWGFSLPPRDEVHTYARLKFVYATDPDLKRIGLTLEALAQIRNAADYQLGTSGPFLSPRIAASALADAQSAVALLDALEADPARRAAATRTIMP